ncbi:MAG TPA: hypothetical protein VFH56_13855 [Acidimicrobiales bacterium]|nr:hypothetical protein [Acidimicrobiales bacterium]
MANPLYCTITEVKQGTQITSGDTTFDQELTDIVTDVSRAIDDQTSSRFYQDDTDVVRHFLPENSGRAVIFPLSSFTSLTTLLDPTDTWTQDTDFYFEPVNAPADGAPWTSIRTIARPFLFTKADVPAGWAALDGRITITGKWGWSAVPGPVRRACVLQSRRIFQRRYTPGGYEAGSIDVPGFRIPRLDPDVQALLDPYTLTWFG